MHKYVNHTYSTLLWININQFDTTLVWIFQKYVGY